MRRQGAKRLAGIFAIALLAGVAFSACSSKDVGQTIYNTGKAYCTNKPQGCGG